VSAPIRHIGVFAACDGRKRGSIHRADLGEERHKQLGVTELFRDEKPYRVCRACIAIVCKVERGLNRILHQSKKGKRK
jgi:hypothetical protein